MAEYIERNKLLHKIRWASDPEDCVMIAKRMPASDVARVRHGRWVDRIVDENEVIQPWMERYYCSECLDGVNQSWFKFCPNCGARMDRG